MIGFLNIYKPSGMTSTAVVSKIKKQFNIKKIGHMGTLDPLACGILPIAIGKATRLFDYSLNKVKRYNVVYEFGYLTDTNDSEGQVVERTSQIPTIEEIENTIKSFVGKSMQIPPKFSANHVDGKRAYDLARSGVEFELKAKPIEIFEFKLLEKINDASFKFTIVCSSGTYIRSVGRDLAEKLNSLCTMTSLERSENGYFTLSNSVALDKLLGSSLEDYLISPIQVFSNFDIIKINDIQTKNLVDGKKLNQNVEKSSFVVNGDKIIGVVKPNSFLKLDTYLGD
ncbi:MAG: tRNA pseudouridine(55) synthase TruB [Clostridiales bacterium]|nr:tRNA pseudouridine(55) synthase TruB [Clostridiales bacterium]